MTILKVLNQAIERGQPAALCTVVNTKGAVPRHTGTKMIVFGDGETQGTVGGGEVEKLVKDEALASLNDSRTRLLDYDLIDTEKGDPGVCGGSLSVYVEPYLTAPTVVIVGAGHVGKAVVHLASWLGFRVVVSDDREELCTPGSIPGADQYLPLPMSQIPEQIAVDTQTYFVLVTRGVDVDVEGLPALLETNAAYIGLIGSTRRWRHAQEKLLEVGLTQEQLDRVKSPIGLFIHAENPEEIAVSIMAEIISRRNEGSRHLQKV